MGLGIRSLAIGILCSALSVCAAQAKSLNLPHQMPDITTWNIDISYNAETDEFTAITSSGGALQYYLPTDTFEIANGHFELSALIDDTGTQHGGWFRISGDVQDGSGRTGNLLEGSLQEFGFVPDGSTGSPTFEFLFSLTQGNLATDFCGVGAPVGLKLSVFDFFGMFPFGGNFHNDYNATMGIANTFSAVPEPATSALLLLGAGGLLVRRRLSRRRAERCNR